MRQSMRNLDLAIGSSDSSSGFYFRTTLMFAIMAHIE